MKIKLFVSEGVRRLLLLIIKPNVLLLILTCCMLTQCSDQNDDVKPNQLPPQEISIKDLTTFLASAYDLPESQIAYRNEADGEYFVLEGDILIKRKTAETYYKEAGGNSQGRSKQRQINSLVNQTTVTDVKVRITANVPADWANATRTAMANWNAVLGTRLTFREVTSGEHIQIFVGTIVFPQAIAEADFPSSGNPGGFVRIDDGHLGEPSKIFVMAHELGHTVGLDHTNVLEPGSSHINGTPVNDPLSVMNAVVAPWTGFTQGDMTAIQILYPPTNEELYIVRTGTFFAADYSTGVGLDIATGWGQTVAMASTGSLIYTVTAGSMYRINPDNNSVISFSDYPNGWAGTEAMAALGGNLYAATGGTLWRVTISNENVEPFSDYPNNWANTEAMAAAGSYIYIVSAGSLWRVNVGNEDVEPFSDYPNGWANTEAMTIYGSYLYAVQGGTMWRVNLSNEEVEPFGDYSDGWAGTEAMTAKDGYLFGSQAGSLWKLNLSTGNVVPLGTSNWAGTEAMAARL